MVARSKSILQGRCVVPGIKQGTALVLTRSISAFGGIDPFNSKIIESTHPQKGELVKRKILVFPNGKGSSGFSLYFHIMSLTGNAPKAMIITKVNSLTALAAVAANIPTITGPFAENRNPLSLIKTGDSLYLDAAQGIVAKLTKES
ncbi:MAG: aconitase X swivel domain-containing protein [Candidatus Helarchaeota archaeon]